MQTPAKKFKAIAEMIGIEELEKEDVQLRMVSNELSKDFEELQNNYNIHINAISKLVGINIIEESDILSGLNSKLKDINNPKLDSLHNLEEYIKDNFKVVMLMGQSSSIQKSLNNITLLSAKLDLEEESINKAKEINELRQKLYQYRIEIDYKLKKFLEKGLGIIEEKKTVYCPLCEQKVDTDELIKNIKNRVSQFELFSEEITQLNLSIDHLKNQLIEHKKLLNAILTEILEFEDLRDFEFKIKSILKLIQEFIQKFLNKEDMVSKIEMKELEVIKKNLTEFSKKTQNICKAKISGLGMTEGEEKAYEILSLLKEIQILYNELKKIEVQVKISKAKYEISNEIYNAFTEIKKEKVNEIFQMLREDIQAFYMFIHPDDPHENIEITLDPKKRASVMLTIDSFDKSSQDPRAFTSEGHLDSLGICLFLAFVKKLNEGLPLIVLDDVITTVDANHRERLAKLLLTEFPEHQLIITTHDGIWYKQLCENQQAYGVKNNYCNMSIVDWNLSCGPGFAEYTNLREKIEGCFQRGEVDIAGFLTRRYMEWLLKEICSKMKASLEYRPDNRYTVEELFNSARLRMGKLCKKVKDNETFRDEILDAFKELESWKYLGNLLSHENPELDIIPTSEIKSFSEKAENLNDCFLCPNCNSFLQYERSYNEIRCPKLRCPDPFIVKLK